MSSFAESPADQVGENRPKKSTEIEELASEFNEEETSITEEVWTLSKLAVPSIFTNMFTASMNIISLMMVGHLGTRNLAASALANTYFNFFYSFMTGVTFAFEALGSQSFGADDYFSLNKLFRQGFVVCGGFLLIASVGLSFSGQFARYVLLQDEEISSIIADFDFLLIPGLWTFTFYQILTKYLQVQNMMKPPMIINLLGNVLNAGLSYYLIYVREFGILGAPIATSIARTIMFILILIFILYLQRFHPPTPPPVSKGVSPLSVSDSTINEESEDALLLEESQESKIHQTKTNKWMRPTTPEKLFNLSIFSIKQLFDFSGMKTLFIISIQGGAMIMAEDLSFEGTTFEAGYINTTALAAHQICLVLITVTFFTFPLGLSVAAGIRIGNLLGSGRPKQARKTANILMVMCFFVMGTLTTAYIVCGDLIGRAFSTDKAVIDQVSRLVYIICIFQFFDGFQGCCGGIMRGISRLGTVGKIHVISLWVVGPPIGAILVFVFGFGVSGLWWGIVGGLALESIIYVVILFRIDWRQEALQATSRNCSINEESSSVSSDSSEGSPEHSQVSCSSVSPPSSPSSRRSSLSPPTPRCQSLSLQCSTPVPDGESKEVVRESQV